MRHEEDALQVQCVHWFRFQFRQYARLLHHSPNGGRRDAREAARFKEMGVQPGFPDLVLMVPAGGYHALCVELKTAKGRQSAYQKDYQERLTERGYLYVVVRSLRQFMAVINDYLLASPRPEK